MGTATFVLGSANQGQAWVGCYFDFRANRGAELNETGQTPDEAVARLCRAGPQQLWRIDPLAKSHFLSSVHPYLDPNFRLPAGSSLVQ
jgi:hypothetical protein